MPSQIAVLKGRGSKRRLSTSVPAPNARSTLIDPLVAVDLFGIEEMKPELLAAGARYRADGAARSSGFISSNPKTLTVVKATTMAGAKLRRREGAERSR